MFSFEEKLKLDDVKLLQGRISACGFKSRAALRPAPFIWLPALRAWEA